MLKWILWTTLVFGSLWYYLAIASYTPISKQIELKTMQIHKPEHIIKSWYTCVWTCRNYSTSSSSYGSSSYWWK